MLGVAVAIVSGMLMSVQGVFNERITAQTSVWVCSSFVQFTALLTCLAAWCISGFGGSFSSLLAVDNKYMLLGGVMGAAITYTVIRSFSSLGAAQAVMIIVVSQLFAAYLVELFGIFGTQKAQFELRKLIAMLICTGGILLFKWEK